MPLIRAGHGRETISNLLDIFQALLSVYSCLGSLWAHLHILISSIPHFYTYHSTDIVIFFIFLLISLGCTVVLLVEPFN
jgi:hypothetical protein